MDGYHIWEAGIILARFITFNSDKFKGKKMLELGSGVGIGGLAAALYTEGNSVIMSDYKNDIIKNIIINCHKNGYTINNNIKDRV